jgi:hypothetical protein
MGDVLVEAASYSEERTHLEPIGYPELNLGLNNQKFALFGIFIKAHALKRPLVLPSFCNFDAAEGNHQIVPLDKVYSLPSLMRFADAFGLEILDQPPVQSENGWNCFIAGTDRLGREAIKGEGALDEFTCQFFRNLVPVITSTAIFRKLFDTVFVEYGVTLVVQLRIENDWAEQAERIKSKPADFQDDFAPTFQEIISKVKNSVRADNLTKAVYVVCDEDNLPVSKEEIKAEILKSYGISLVWKSDILGDDEISSLSILDRSIIDFEMSVHAPVFVGFSRSTFSNLVNFEAFCRRGKLPPHHYIYNLPGRLLGRRCDYGTKIDPAEVTNNLYSRTALIPDAVEDCLWPASITAHISRFGDFTSFTSTIYGTRRGALVVGERFNPHRLIEGFSIEFTAELPGSLEYRAKLEDGTWTQWVPAGSFAGSRGQGKSLRGFAVRLTGRLALGYECVCVGSFEGSFEVLETYGSQDCCPADASRLEAMQIVFRPKISP